MKSIIKLLKIKFTSYSSKTMKTYDLPEQFPVKVKDSTL
jgi:hypothetical protein